MNLEIDTKRKIVWWKREDDMIFPVLKLEKPIGISKIEFENSLKDYEICKRN